MEPDWLSTTQPFYSERIVFGQLIRPKKVTNYFDLAENFNLGPQFLISYLSMLVVLLLVCVALKTACGRLSSQPNGQPNKENEKLDAQQSFGSKLNQFVTFLHAAGSLPPFAVLFLFLNLFVWFTLLFFLGNIKTRKVVLGEYPLRFESI